MQFSNNLLRLGTESAFEVLARAQSMVSKGRDIEIERIKNFN